MFLIVDLIVGIAMGFIPGIDNFAHLGGLLMGLLCAIVLYPVISTTKRHNILMWIARFAAIPLAVVLYVLLVRNFYTTDPFSCTYSCRHCTCDRVWLLPLDY